MSSSTSVIEYRLFPTDIWSDEVELSLQTWKPEFGPDSLSLAFKCPSCRKIKRLNGIQECGELVDVWVTDESASIRLHEKGGTLRLSEGCHKAVALRGFDYMLEYETRKEINRARQTERTHETINERAFREGRSFQKQLELFCRPLDIRPKRLTEWMRRERWLSRELIESIGSKVKEYEWEHSDWSGFGRDLF